MKRYSFNFQDSVLMVTGLIIPMFIILRDIYAIEINKYILVGIIALIALLFLDVKNIITLFCYLIPFFSGIAGNYIIMILLILIIFKGKVKLPIKPFLLILVLLIIELINNLGYTLPVIEFIMYSLYYIFIIILVSVDSNMQQNIRNIMAFSIGTTAALTIILLNSLTFIEFNDFFNSGYRFGNILDLTNAGNMALTHDQNFIGYLSIIGITSLYVVIRIKYKKNIIDKVVIFGCIGLLVFYSLLTSSRAFLISFVLLLIFYLLNNLMKLNIRHFLTISLLIVFAYLYINIFYPDIVTNYITRFSVEEITGGRSEINSFYFNFFINDLKVFLIGTGVFPMLEVANYNAAIHNATLQILVSYGIIGSLIFIAWYYYLVKKEVNKKTKRISLVAVIPHIMGLIIIQSIPFINPYYGMLPMIITVYAFRLNDNLHMKED